MWTDPSLIDHPLDQPPHWTPADTNAVTIGLALGLFIVAALMLAKVAPVVWASARTLFNWSFSL